MTVTETGDTADFVPNGDTTLYAVWQLSATFWNITTMQEMTSTACTSATTPVLSATNLDTTGAHAGNTAYVPQTTLRDTRDNNSYTIKKLPDGRCWMVTNLNYAQGSIHSNSYGQYYNWSTAQTVCPASWHIPAPSDFVALDIAYGGNGVSRRENANTWNYFTSSGAVNINFSPGGGWRDGAAIYSNYYYYWQSGEKSSDLGNLFFMIPSTKRIDLDSNNDPKRSGALVRCIADY